MKKFWNWVKNEDNRTIYFDGYIAQDSWFDDDITPKKFKAELLSDSGDISVWLNSPGGDVFAASQIYTMLKEYAGKVSVRIDGLAASAASVIAMAGDEIIMSPVAMMMIHNPSTIAIGDSEEMLRAKALLDEVKESIINAYELKSGLSRTKLSHLMDAETWMNANKAIELGFADKIMFAEDEDRIPLDTGQGLIFSRAAVCNSLLGKIPKKSKPKTGTPIESLEKRLSLISH